MKTKMSWETLIFETVQMGGSLIFLKDQSPQDLALWLKPLTGLLLGEIPFAHRSCQDFLAGRFETKPQDLVVFFSTQVGLVDALDSVLQGQRILLWDKDTESKANFFDYVWSNCSLKEWNQVFHSMHAAWGEKPCLVDVSQSHQARCLFLDRDDVVVKNVPYNSNPDRVELMPGIVGLISRAHRQGYWVAMVTNQSGLGRRLISWREFQLVHQKTLELLAESGCWLDECVWSGYIDQQDLPQGRLLASLRKPRAGMFQLVNEKLKVHMASSVMVGDSASDLIAARSAGVGNLVLLASPKTEKEQKKLEAFQGQYPDFHYSLVDLLSQVTL